MVSTVVEQYPFELTESGWGEFLAIIRLHFKDPDEQPVDLFHHLRLYPPNSQPQLSQKRVRCSFPPWCLFVCLLLCLSSVCVRLVLF
jgi:hypothetical protein